MKKRNILIALVALLAIVFGGRGAYAYFTDAEKTQNNITIGTNEIEIVEEFPTPPDPVVGDNNYKKVVSVKNTGDVDCFVRVFAEFEDADVRKVAQYSKDNGSHYFAEAAYRSNNLPEGWGYVSTGNLAPYYYYTKALKPNESTTNLFTNLKVTFATADDVEDFKFTVYAESVQTYDKNGTLFTGANAYQSAWEEFLGN